MRKRLATLAIFLLLGLATTVLLAFVLAVTIDTSTGAASQAQTLEDSLSWTINRSDRAGAVHIQSLRSVSVSWSPQQAAGRPDTPTAGDQVTAWASQSADAGIEWLILDYAKPVIPRQLDVYESCAPGALIKVSIFDENGQEIPAWSGTDPTPASASIGVSKIPITLTTPTSKVKIYLDCKAVPGWNEIDAVALIDNQNQTQFARHVTASSTYASVNNGTPSLTPGNPTAILPAWASELAMPSNEITSGEVNREERHIDARGWPLLALKSTDMVTPAIPVPGNNLSNPVTGITPYPVQRNITSTYSGLIAISASAPGHPARLPSHPIWTGLLIDTAIFALAWATLWYSLTIPRRFVQEVARIKKGGCLKCGYDLGYNFQNGCPECGWRKDPKSHS